MNLPRERFTLIATHTDDHLTDFAHDVRAGLTQHPKRLSCRYFYDREGSLLFEAICELPEYYLTRVERAILRERADEIAAQCPENVTLVELGSGSAAKTRLLIEAFLRRQGTLRFVPVDISRSALEESSLALLEDYPRLQILAVAAEYNDGVRQLQTMADEPKLVLWLGSNVGNFERPDAGQFLRRVRDTMSSRDRLLVGIDMRKERDVLERAYDDARGVTAQFNLNLLVRINRELGGHFDLKTFRHRAIYNEEMGRIEMYLVSTCVQRVTIDNLDLEVSFAEDEAMHTENSYKYSEAEVEALADAAGLRTERRWFDAARWFSVNLFAL